MINVVFLGTGGSTPTKDRSLPSVAIQYEGETLLFDCGEGTQRQFINYSFGISKVNSIFISHIHGDHVIGVAGLIRTLALNGRAKPLYIFVPKGEENSINALATFDRAFIHYPIIIKPIKSGTILKGKGFRISAFQINHSVKTYGFVFKENDKLHFIKEKCTKLGIKGTMFSELEKRGFIKIKGKIIKLTDVTTKEEGKKVVYVTDTRPTSSTVKASLNANLLIHEATYEETFKKFAIQRKHSTAKEAATIAKNAHVKSLILFHMSARYKETDKIIKEAKKVFKNTRIAYDGMKVSL
jgi:ribonuclease Z